MADVDEKELAAAEEQAHIYNDWIDEQVGPREVGGTYYSGYWREEYEVVAIDRGPRDGWPTWQITERTVGSKEQREHCTWWDPEAGDRVISEPEPEGR